MSSINPSEYLEEKQLTHDLTYNHDLDNNDNFSPDDQWLVYDTRTHDGGIAISATIEKVNVKTQEKKVLYHIDKNKPYGPGAGAVSYSHAQNAVVFINGLDNCTEANPYQQWKRTGVIIEDAAPQKRIFMDARDVTYPFTPGALRGGTHRHEWSGDGQWVGYTYNDAILKELEDKTGEKHNLRTIGVSKKGKAVKVDKDAAGENVSGQFYSVLVVRVVPEPKAGSDEISHAASDSWVGMNGYTKADGSKQVARAFVGKVRDENGKSVDEVFIVDIPNDITVPGEHGPLQGTKTEFPMPPKGTVQRRLTFTAKSAHPGTSGVTRSSPDGSQIAYVGSDSKGIKQIFLISPKGGNPVQLTDHTTSVEGCVRWSPDGKSVCYAAEGSIVLCKLGSEPFAKRHKKLTAPTKPSPGNMVWSHDGKSIAFNRTLKSPGNDEGSVQVFIINL